MIDRISEAVRNGDEETFRKLISLFRFYEAANLNQLDSVSYKFACVLTFNVVNFVVYYFL